MNALEAIKSLGASTTSSATTKKQTLGQDEFLKLMTTQMTHQDPTKPMDNAQFLSQMAQFGTVSGIQDLQQSFKDFSASISSDQALQATSLVGRTVSIPTDEITLGSGKTITGFVDLPASSPSVNIKVLDSNGDVIRSQSLGEQSSGTVNFTWDGNNDKGNLAAPGSYKIQVEALVNGTNTALQPNIQDQVSSVSMGNDSHGLLVNLAGQGAVNFSKISQISNKGL